MDKEALRILNYLASFPSGTSTCDKKIAKELLKNGIFFGRGEAYRPVVKHLGLGIYEISAKLAF